MMAFFSRLIEAKEAHQQQIIATFQRSLLRLWVKIIEHISWAVKKCVFIYFFPFSFFLFPFSFFLFLFSFFLFSDMRVKSLSYSLRYVNLK